MNRCFGFRKEIWCDFLQKSNGPFIGPRGGKWANPEHTIPWKEGFEGKTLSSPPSSSNIVIKESTGGFKSEEKYSDLNPVQKNEIKQAIYTAKGVKDHVDGWKFFLSPESYRSEAYTKYIETNKDIIQDFWNKYRLPIIPPHNVNHLEDVKMNPEVVKTLKKNLDSLSLVIDDFSNTITQSGIKLIVAEDAKVVGKGAKQAWGSYSRDQHLITISQKSEANGTFLHELIHALDYSKAVDSGILFSSQQEDLFSGETLDLPDYKLHDLPLDEPDKESYKEYLDRPREKLARLFQEFSGIALNDTHSRKYDSQTGEERIGNGFWGSDVMADHADAIAKLGKDLGIKFKLDYIEKVKRKEVHPDIAKKRDLIQANKLKEIYSEEGFDSPEKGNFIDSWEFDSWSNIPKVRQNKLMSFMDEKLRAAQKINDVVRDEHLQSTIDVAKEAIEKERSGVSSEEDLRVVFGDVGWAIDDLGDLLQKSGFVIKVQTSGFIKLLRCFF